MLFYFYTCHTLSEWKKMYAIAKNNFVSDAHPQSQITRLVWLDEETLISVGQDCNTKIWRIEKI